MSEKLTLIESLSIYSHCMVAIKDQVELYGILDPTLDNGLARRHAANEIHFLLSAMNKIITHREFF